MLQRHTANPGLLPLIGLLPLSIITCLDVLQKVVHVIFGAHPLTLPLPRFTGLSGVVSSQTAARTPGSLLCTVASVPLMMVMFISMAHGSINLNALCTEGEIFQKLTK